MSERLPWFRCFPSALLGAIAGMEADEGFVFITVLMRIYETGGPVSETARTLSRRTGLNDRKVTSALSRLFASGKLVKLDGDRIDAPSTHEELAWQGDRKREQSSAGKSSAAKRSNKTEKERELDGGEKPQENQQNEATRVERPFNHIDKDLEEEKEKKKKEEETAGAGHRHHQVYAFEAGIIRLVETDLARWVKAYSNINVEAELHSLSDWAGKQPDWFHAVKGALGKRDREAMLAKEKIRAEAAAGAKTAASQSFLTRGLI